MSESSSLGYLLGMEVAPFTPSINALEFIKVDELDTNASTALGGYIDGALRSQELVEWAAITERGWVTELMKLCLKPRAEGPLQGMADQLIGMLSEMAIEGAKHMDRKAFIASQRKEAAQLLRVLQAKEKGDKQPAH